MKPPARDGEVATDADRRGPAVLDRIADGDLTLRDVVDPRRGLVYQFVENWEGDGPPPRGEGLAHLCGATLSSRLPSIQKELGAGVRSMRSAPYDYDCTATKVGIECVFSDSGGEWAQSFDVLFASCARGLCVVAIDDHPGGTANDQDSIAAFDSALAAASQAPCP